MLKGRQNLRCSNSRLPMASNCTTQVSVEAGSTWAQRSGISFLKGLRAIERAWICHYAFRSTEPSKKRRVRSPTPRRSFSPSFFFFLYIYIDQVKLHLWLRLSWSEIFAPVTSSEHGFHSKRAGFNKYWFHFVACYFGSFYVKPITATILSTGHLINYESFCSWKYLCWFFD